MKIAVVIAAYDERPNIDSLVERLDRSLSEFRGRRQLIFVVDGDDGTREAIEARAGEIPDLVVIHRRSPRGLAEAFRTGFGAVAADVDRVVTLDADLNHQPEEIPGLLAAMDRTGAEIVVGSRDVPGAEVIGIPRWKRLLSRAVNTALTRLTGCPAIDKTSGFRIYRSAALRRLEVRSGGFSFLADLLLQASTLGMTIHEEPIRFVYRVAGRSKLPFLRTSFDYVRLLAAAMPRSDRTIALWLLAGVALRLIVTYPVHRYFAEGDASLTGLGALRILAGEPLVFFNGVRIGAVGCYLAAGLFSLFGAGRATLAAVPLLFDVGTLIFGLLFLRELVGGERAARAMPLLALPPPAVVLWSYMPVGYAELLFAGSATLWLAARVVRRGPAPGRLAALGVAVGLALWTSLLALCVVVPALLWVAIRCRVTLLTVRSLASGMAGFLAGSWPWWVYNLRHDFASLRSNFAARAVESTAGAFDNLAYTTTVRLPELLARTQSLRAYLGDGAARTAIGAGILFAYAALLVLAFAGARGGRQRDAGRRSVELADACWLGLGVAGVTLLANMVSGAGSARGQTERYLLPLFLVLPLLALLARNVRGAGGRIAGLLVALVLLFDLAAIYGPWHPSRRRWAREAREDAALVERLASSGIEAIGGSYDQVYALNFLSNEALFGLPVEQSWDARGVGLRLPARPLRWALVARGREELQALATCGPELLPAGRLESLGVGRAVWLGGELAERGPDTAAELARVRAACHGLGRADARL